MEQNKNRNKLLGISHSICLIPFRSLILFIRKEKLAQKKKDFVTTKIIRRLEIKTGGIPREAAQWISPKLSYFMAF